jgi:glycosyltransferase 2 family protein
MVELGAEQHVATPRRLMPVLRVVLIVAALGIATLFLATHWTAFRTDLGRLGWRPAVGSVPSMVAGLTSGMLAWRAILASLGSRIPLSASVRIYFIGQLGKYVPGSMWPVLAQMELGRDHHIPRRRSAVALMMAIVTSLATGAIAAAVAVPFLPTRYRNDLWWLLLGIPVCLAVLHPPVMMACLRRVPRLKLVEDIQAPRRAAMAVAAAWAFLGWILFGLHVAILAAAFHPHRAGALLAVSIGGYALAWCAGLVAFVLPAGAGARDLVLGAALSAVIPATSAVVVVVVSRVVTTLCDLGCAGLAVLIGRNRLPGR